MFLVVALLKLAEQRVEMEFTIQNVRININLSGATLWALSTAKVNWQNSKYLYTIGILMLWSQNFVACKPNMQRTMIHLDMWDDLDVLTCPSYLLECAFRGILAIFPVNHRLILASSRKSVRVPSSRPRLLQHGIAAAWLTLDWHLHPSLVNAYGKY